MGHCDGLIQDQFSLPIRLYTSIIKMLGQVSDCFIEDIYKLS